MRIVMVFADSQQEWNCSQWRVLEPAKALGRLHNVGVAVMSTQVFGDLDNKQARDEVGAADVVHIQRNIVLPQVIRACQYWLGAGKCMTLDLDDAYQMLPPTNVAYDFWQRNANNFNPPPLEALRRVMPHLAGFTSPSKLLLEDWKPHYRRGFWWPNWTTNAWYEGLKKEPHEGTIIGWGGSSSHWDTWWFTPAGAALARVCELRPQVKVRICGGDTRIFEMLPVPADHKEYVPYTQPADWPRNLAQFDIGLAPLAEEYDQRRSWIKGVEYLLARVPWVGTEGWPYADLAPWGTFVPNTLDAWVEALLKMVDNPPDTMPGYLVGLEMTLERRAPDLLKMFQHIATVHQMEHRPVVLRDCIYV